VTRLRFTVEARKDLLEIWKHVATQTSPASADRVLDSIERGCRVLEDYPQMGRARPEIEMEARSLVIERWLALYRATPSGPEIVRVVDGARDLKALAWPPE